MTPDSTLIVSQNQPAFTKHLESPTEDLAGSLTQSMQDLSVHTHTQTGNHSSTRSDPAWFFQSGQ